MHKRAFKQTLALRHVRALGRSVRATQITRFGRDAGGQGRRRRWSTIGRFLITLSV
jgi:hypothetical protein